MKTFCIFFDVFPSKQNRSITFDNRNGKDGKEWKEGIKRVFERKH